MIPNLGKELMPRPRNCRRVALLPQSDYFKPRGIPLSVLEQIVLTVDEFEAIRLADMEGMYQADAAEKMGISRQTFGRIIESAHKKIAEALVQGKALKIEGGQFRMASPDNVENVCRINEAGQSRGRFRRGRGCGGRGRGGAR